MTTTTRPRKIAQTEAEMAETLAHLRDIFPEGSDVFTVRMHSSASGITHHVRVFGVDHAGITRVSHLVVKAGIGRLSADQNVVVRGGGMPMDFDIVDSLSRKLYGKGYKLHHVSV